MVAAPAEEAEAQVTGAFRPLAAAYLSVTGGGPPPCHASLSLRPQVVAEELEERGEGWKRKSSLGGHRLKHPYPRNGFLPSAPGRKGAGGACPS
uniref:Uncharacterized protein n=1 Tax=Oryza barthii TaxID=65489 RepID=A0A0D3GHQ4_9ORYZ